MKTRKDTAWRDLVTHDHWVSTRFDLGAQQYQAEIYVKVPEPRGIKHLLWWGREYNEDRLLRDALLLGTFSTRPYRLGQGADITTAACLSTLYHHFCAERNLDPEALYSKAYGKRVEPDYDPLQTRQLAEWQGLEYPSRWGTEEALQLLHVLTAINNHGLVTSILDAVPALEEHFYPKERRTGGTCEERND